MKRYFTVFLVFTLSFFGLSVLSLGFERNWDFGDANWISGITLAVIGAAIIALLDTLVAEYQKNEKGKPTRNTLDEDER